jgi:hypothetical protein
MGCIILQHQLEFLTAKACSLQAVLARQEAIETLKGLLQTPDDLRKLDSLRGMYLTEQKVRSTRLVVICLKILLLNSCMMLIIAGKFTVTGIDLKNPYERGTRDVKEPLYRQ